MKKKPKKTKEKKFEKNDLLVLKEENRLQGRQDKYVLLKVSAWRKEYDKKHSKVDYRGENGDLIVWMDKREYCVQSERYRKATEQEIKREKLKKMFE